MFSLSGANVAWNARMHIVGNGHKDVVGRYNGSAGANTTMCFEGVTSDGNNCGPIKGVAIDLFDGTYWHHNMDCIDSNDDSDDGDSGGPFFRVQADGRAKAAGILTGGYYVAEGPPYGNYQATCYSLINYTVFFHNAELVTN